jgi:ubiquitin-like protein ATG12
LQVVYCNSAFAPSPEARVADLAACFQVEGELILNYCPTEAWG